MRVCVLSAPVEARRLRVMDSLEEDGCVMHVKLPKLLAGGEEVHRAETHRASNGSHLAV